MLKSIYITFSIFLLLELTLRVLPTLIKDPLRSLILEARRVPYSNTRTYAGFSGGTRVLLPQPFETDIVILGDSIPFGTYVKSEDIFSARLSKNLGLKTVNLGVASTSPPEYNQMLHEGLKYRPRIIVYCIFANDFGFNGDRETTPASDLFLRSLSPSEVIAHYLKHLTNLSLSYQLLKFFQQPAAHHQSILWSDSTRSLAFAPQAYWDPYLDWNLPNVQRSVEANLRYVTEAARTASKNRAGFFTILFPSKEMVFGPQINGLPQPIYSETHHLTYQKFQKGLTQVKIPVLDLTGELRKEAADGKKLFHTIDGHYDEEGHAVIAELLTPSLRSFLADKKTVGDF